MSENREAILALADGTVFRGRGFGADGETAGEVVFNTAMTGYQEILTDPSYCGQIICMTYPEIGNVGVNPEDVESRRPFAAGFVVREAWETPSNWRARSSLSEYLREQGIVGIADVDTRALVRHVRNEGAQTGVISTVDGDPDRLVRKAREFPPMEGRNLVDQVSCTEPYDWDETLWSIGLGYGRPEESEERPFVVAYDFGIKRNILRHLTSAGCRVRVVPARTPPADALAMDPDGIFLSNGPGDPEPVRYAVDTIRALIGRKPIFGICLGHQLLGLALGGRTYKLKFGHHGANQPVLDLATRKVEITSQNHGFAVDVDSLEGLADLTHVNLNDRTVEGFEMKSRRLLSIQYHPEASPGPHDASYLFRRFVEMIQQG